jgi:16S rRNA (uracil1498-N3)-methyltransferase
MPIERPTSFIETAETVSNQKDTLNMLPWESEEDKNILTVLNENKDIKNINIFIGPEGGFDKTEIDIAIKKGFKTVTLGKNILRVETAAIVASSIVTAMTGL